MDYRWWIGVGVLGILFFMGINRSVKTPLFWIGKGILYTAVGALILFVVNMLGQYVHIQIPINLVTAFVAGVLGFPGLIYLAAVKIIFIGV
ncbi:MAG: pro-sigmaK processing inhibitor BofA family protein [Thermoactinomyces sp.]